MLIFSWVNILEEKGIKTNATKTNVLVISNKENNN